MYTNMHACLPMYMRTRMPKPTQGGQRTTCRGHLSPSTMWVWWINLRLLAPGSPYPLSHLADLSPKS